MNEKKKLRFTKMKNSFASNVLIAKIKNSVSFDL